MTQVAQELIGKPAGIEAEVRFGLVVVHAIDIADECEGGPSERIVTYVEAPGGVMAILREDGEQEAIGVDKLERHLDPADHPGFYILAEKYGIDPDKLRRIVSARAPQSTGTSSIDWRPGMQSFFRQIFSTYIKASGINTKEAVVARAISSALEQLRLKLVRLLSVSVPGSGASAAEAGQLVTAACYEVLQVDVSSDHED
jgi:hypothetical protein